MTTIKKIVGTAWLIYGVFSLTIAIPILGITISAGAAFLGLPSWIYGACAAFTGTSVLCYGVCNTKQREELRGIYPIFVGMMFMTIPGLLVVGMSTQVEGVDTRSEAIIRSVGVAMMWVGFFVMPLLLWIASVCCLVTTIKIRNG